MIINTPVPIQTIIILTPNIRDAIESLSAFKQVVLTLVQDLFSLASAEDADMLATFLQPLEAAHKYILTLLSIAGIHIHPRSVVLGL